MLYYIRIKHTPHTNQTIIIISHVTFSHPPITHHLLHQTLYVYSWTVKMSKLNVHYPSILHSWLNIYIRYMYTLVYIRGMYMYCTCTHYSPSIHQPISILFVRVYGTKYYISLCAHITLYFSPYHTVRVHDGWLYVSYIHLPQYDQALFSIIIETPSSSSSSLSLTNVYQFICRYHLSYNYEYIFSKNIWKC